MTPLPRARCPVCDRDVALRKDRGFRQHVLDPRYLTRCPASGIPLGYLDHNPTIVDRMRQHIERPRRPQEGV